MKLGELRDKLGEFNGDLEVNVSYIELNVEVSINILDVRVDYQNDRVEIILD